MTTITSNRGKRKTDSASAKHSTDGFTMSFDQDTALNFIELAHEHECVVLHNLQERTWTVLADGLQLCVVTEAELQSDYAAVAARVYDTITEYKSASHV